MKKKIKVFVSKILHGALSILFIGIFGYLFLSVFLPVITILFIISLIFFSFWRNDDAQSRTLGIVMCILSCICYSLAPSVWLGFLLGFFGILLVFASGIRGFFMFKDHSYYLN